MNLVIIDTGCANLSSVKFAFDRLGVNAIVSDDVYTIGTADKLILPGVGTASFAMQTLAQKNLIAPIQNAHQPLLGICLGMQLLTRSSNENGQLTKCLGVIDVPTDKLNYPVLPHMGWNTLRITQPHALLKGIGERDFVYFVHSYGVSVQDKSVSADCTLAVCEYGTPFVAVIGCGNFFGMQFHPEKSGKVGAKLLHNFLQLPCALTNQFGE